MDKIIGRKKNFAEAVEYVIDKIRLGRKCFVVSTEYGRIFFDVSREKPSVNHQAVLYKWDDVPANKKMIPYLRDKTINFYAEVRKYRSNVLMEREVAYQLAQAAVYKLCGCVDYRNYSDVIVLRWMTNSLSASYGYTRDIIDAMKFEFFSSWIDRVLCDKKTYEMLRFIERSMEEKETKIRHDIQDIARKYTDDGILYDLSTNKFDGFEVVLLAIAANHKGIERLPKNWAEKLTAANNRAECILEILAAPKGEKGEQNEE